MLCPKCKIEAGINGSGYVVENDTTPDAETKLFIEQHFYCRNPQCSDYKKEVGTVRRPLKLIKDATE